MPRCTKNVRVLILVGLLLTTAAVVQGAGACAVLLNGDPAPLGPQVVALEAMRMPYPSEGDAPHVYLSEGDAALLVSPGIETVSGQYVTPYEVLTALLEKAGLKIEKVEKDGSLWARQPGPITPGEEQTYLAQSQIHWAQIDAAIRAQNAAWNAYLAQIQAARKAREAWAAYYRSLPTHPAQRRFYELVDDPSATMGEIGLAMLDAQDEIQSELRSALRSLRR